MVEVLLKLAHPGSANEEFVSDQWWQVSARLYFAEFDWGWYAAAIGTFLGSGYSLAVPCYNRGVPVVPLTALSNQAILVSTQDSSVVHFDRPASTRWRIANVGDANGDACDDLLVSADSGVPDEECWLVFGGSNWHGSVNLTNLGSRGVTLHSVLYPVPPFMQEPRVGGLIGGVGDLNGDGLMDFAYTDVGMGEYSYCVILYGQTNMAPIAHAWHADGFRGFLLKEWHSVPQFETAEGDINNDGHMDLVFSSDGKALVFYCGPFIKPEIECDSLDQWINGTNGIIVDPERLAPGRSFAIDGDVNGDGYDDLSFIMGSSSYSTNSAWVVYGGQSPSTPPAVRTPVWINVGESASVDVQYTDLPTNIVWTGCKKGDDYTFCHTNGAACPAWDVPMGVLYFTNSVAVSSTSDVVSIAYTSTNALGPAAGVTTLVIQPLPEPVQTGIVALAAALLVRMLY